jgi:hypothetical protein
MKTLDLKLVKLDEELFDEFIEYVIALSHQLSSLLLCHLTRFVYFRLLEVGEDKNEYPASISRNLNKIYVAAFIIHDLVEITIEDLTFHRDTFLVISDLHRRRSLGGYQVETTCWLTSLWLLRGLVGWFKGRHSRVTIE